MRAIMFGISKATALAGGFVLVAIIALTCVSVTGRSLNTIGHLGWIKDHLPFLSTFFQSFGPVNGDYELIEVGIAFAIFAFLPWCQLNRGHASVEILTAMMPTTANRVLSLVWETVFTLLIILITFRHYVGMTDKMRYGETSFLIQFPTWWGYAVCLVPAVIASVVGIYSAWLHARELFTNQDTPGLNRSAGH